MAFTDGTVPVRPAFGRGNYHAPQRGKVSGLMTGKADSTARRSSATVSDLLRRLTSGAGAATFVAYLTTAMLRRGAPRQIALEERLASLSLAGAPVREPVRIYWNEHHIPFIEASHDSDLATGLGVVHAHLRLAQIDFMRRIALGRLAEVVGPMAASSDHALRVLDFRRAGAAVETVLPSESREWLDAFRAGINWHIAGLTRPPYEFEVLGVRPEQWSFSDLLAVSRLASLDFTWKVWMRLLKLRRRPEWSDMWERLMSEPTIQPPSVAGSNDALEGLLEGFGRSGSNAYAIAPGRTANGAAMIANDPHLSISLPNNWIILGMKSPSYHAVGMMVPGVPLMGLGRSPWMAWGGTSLHGASSELVDLTSVPGNGLSSRETTIRVRWGRNRKVRIRDSAFGPVISDARLLRMGRDSPVALHWMGHRASDEVTPFLNIAKARSWQDFLSALDGYAIPGLNMIYADAEGHIGQAIAATLPRRPHEPPKDIISGAEALDHWASFVSSRDLPNIWDPPEGFVASANNAPPPSDVSLSLFFSPDDRVRRLRDVLSNGDSFSVSDLARLQTDVTSASARELRDLLAYALAKHLPETPNGQAAPLIDALREWDGTYRAESTGALAFELLSFHLVGKLHGRIGAQLYSATWDQFSLLRRDLDQIDRQALQTPLGEAVAAAARRFSRLGTWGDMHRLRLAHAFAMLPLAGRRYVFLERGASGNNETLMKTAHGFSGSRHRVRFGQDARHISDMSDLDANYFVLLGGQDGWLGSTTFMDHLPLWDSAAHIRVPLRIETVRSEFPHLTTLTPKKG